MCVHVLSIAIRIRLCYYCVVQVIRHYHGHLSGVYALALHPTLDLLVTGGRDSVARVWDMRTKQQVTIVQLLPFTKKLSHM
jgi:WD40 repeat protein